MSLYSALEQPYKTRFIPQADAAGLINDYHVARSVVGSSRHARMVQAAAWYAAGHPQTSSTAAYKDLDGLLA